LAILPCHDRPPPYGEIMVCVQADDAIPLAVSALYVVMLNYW